MKKLLLICFAFIISNTVYSQYSITATGIGNTYIQNFDTFRGTAATLPLNWGVSAVTYNTTFPVVTSAAASPTVANASGNNCYAGRATSTSTDYSILQKQATTGSTTFTFSTVNNTASILNGFVVNWNVEQFNKAGRATTVELSYNINGGAYVTTGITGTNLFTGLTGTDSSFLLSSTSRSVTLSGLSISAGANVNFRFNISNGTGSGSNAHIGIDDFSVYATGAALAPEIDITGNNVSIVNNDVTPNATDFTSFGSLDITTGSLVRIFTIKNIGSANLLLSGTPIVSISGVNASDFSITQPTISTITGPTGTTTFSVTFDPASIGTKDASISIISNDSDESPYVFSIQGIGVTPTITSSVTTLSGFSYIQGFGPSSNQSFTLSGVNLTNSISLVAPADYEFSTSSTGPFLSSLTLNPVSGIVANTVIYVRLKAGLLIASYFGQNINITTTNGTNTTVVLNGNVTTPLPEINIERSTGATIPSGSIANNGFDTIFAAQTIGNSGLKTYTIRNQGTASLNIFTITSNSSDFSIAGLTLPTTILPLATVTFTVNFSPTTSGIRNGVVSISNNDNDENPYTFGIQGTGNCGSYTNALFPISGPVGTEVLINAVSGNLNGASVTFNGVSASLIQVSTSQIKAIVPNGASTGSLITLNAQGCSVSTLFTVISSDIFSCQAAGTNALTTPNDLFMSQVTDTNTGSLTYIEIYNGTGTSKNISNYSIKLYNNGGASATSTLPLVGGTILPGGIFTLAIGADGTSPYNSCSGLNDATNGTLANQINTTLGGVNFTDTTNNNGHDHLRLFNGTTQIDSWGVFGNQSWASSLNLGGKGVNFSRKNSAVLPNVLYSNSDWNITDWVTCANEDYSDINTYIFSVAVPPTIVTQPVFVNNCISSLSVAAIEGYNGVGDNQELTYQWYSVAPLASTWTPLVDGGIYSGATTSNLIISSLVSVDGYQYYCQVRENGATCFRATNAVKIIYTNTATTWNGVSWSNGLPNATSAITFTADYQINTDFDACTILVTNNSNIIVDPSIDVSVFGAITIDSGSSFLLNNNSNLLQTLPVANSGNVKVKRQSSLLKRLDYTLWSSPVNGSQTLLQFSPATLTNRFNTYNSLTNLYTSVPPSTTTFAESKGYLIRTPNNHPLTPTIWEANFEGNPNNGNKSFALQTGYNAVGNPFPSRLNIYDFIDQNPSIDGTLYFWRKTNDNTQTSYATVTKLAYTANNALGGNTGLGFFNVNDEANWAINIGQGFLVNSTSTVNLSFNNGMRRSSNLNQFFRNSNSQIETSLYWLNLSNTSGLFSQMAIGHTNEATLDVDRGIDGKNINSEFYLTSLIGVEEYSIQGRPDFQITDKIPLSYKVNTSGQYSIAINNATGIFATGNQEIFIKDNTTQTISSLNNGAFTFNTDAGTFSNRFELVYQDNTLTNIEVNSNKNNLLVYKDKNDIVINSNQTIEKVKVYDLKGRILKEVLTKNDTNLRVNMSTSTQILLVEVTLSNGIITNRKIIFDQN
jgi:hypothetical protein